MDGNVTFEALRKMTGEERKDKMKTLIEKQNFLMSRRQKVIDFRKTAPKQSKFDTMCFNYARKYIHTGSIVPVVHVISIVAAVGIGMEYIGHHRPAKLAAAKKDH